jgi:hypothetical protein
MKILRLPLLTIMAISVVLSPTAGTAEQRPAARPLVLPLAGTGSGGVTFSGTVAVQRFVLQDDGQVAAIGAVSGSLSGPAGPIGTAVSLPVEFPVRVDGRTARAERGLIHPASLSAPDYGARVILAQAPTCGVLHVDLGSVNLNLLGVVVATSPVTIDINGDTGGALGALVCAILNNVGGLVNLLNSLLGVVTGLLGGLTGGLGGAVPL